MTPATSSSAPSPNGETDMNDIDIDIVERLRALEQKPSWVWPSSDMQKAADEIERLRDNAATMFAAIETGRQWETIARRYRGGHGHLCLCPVCAAFRDLADRTLTPPHDGGAG